MSSRNRKPKTSTKQGLENFWFFIETMPIAVPAAIAAFGTVAITLLLLGQLKDVFIWPLGIAAAAAAFIAVARTPIKYPGSEKEQHSLNLLVLVGVLIWLIWNVQYTSQNVFVNRDPGIYTVAGAWLIDNHSFDIGVPTVFGSASGIEGGSSAFMPDLQNPERLSVQGLHLLPVLLGLAGRAGGEAFMLHLNPLFGATALLAVYAFARFLVRPLWAAITTMGFSLTLPLLYFSRDTYTEPLSATLVFGSLALLWLAQKSKRNELWFLAGLTAGAGALVRADGYIMPIIFAAFLVVLLAVSKTAERMKSIKQSALLLAGLLIASVLGWLDVTKLSSAYYVDISDEIRQQFLLLSLIIMAGALVITICWRTRLLANIGPVVRKWRPKLGYIAGLIVVLAAIILITRPLWQVSHDASQPDVIQSYIARLQANEGVAVDRTRNYAENTATWIVWYLGPMLAVLGSIGLALAAALSVKKSNLLLVPGILAVAGTSLIFMIKVGITPDHVWAVRRFLPITLPGLSIFAALTLESISKLEARIRGYGLLKGAFMATTCFVVVAGPLYISYPYLRTRTHTPQLAQIQDVCNALPDRAAVLWVGPSGWNTIQSVRSFCDVPAMRVEKPALSVLAAAAAHAKDGGYNPVVAVTGFEAAFLPDPARAGLAEISNISYEVVPSRLLTPPRGVGVNNRAILVGLLKKDGSTAPIYQQHQ